MAKQASDGFLCRFEVRETPTKGRGVFALEPIARGSLVWRFRPGLFHVYDEPAFIALIEGMPRDQVVYEFTHVFGFADFPTCVIRVLDEGALINHAGAANLATNFAAPFAARPDPSSPTYLRDVAQALLEDRFALIALRDIEVGEEFTVNYSEDIYDPPFFLRLYEEHGIVETYLD